MSSSDSAPAAPPRRTNSRWDVPPYPPPTRPDIRRVHLINMRVLREARRRLEQLEDNECKICLEDLHEPVETIWGHIFGRDCIVKVVSEGGDCPMCRYPLEMDDMRRLVEYETKRQMRARMGSQDEGHGENEDEENEEQMEGNQEVGGEENGGQQVGNEENTEAPMAAETNESEDSGP
ncbi:hypothetical protein M409DRAFT_22291 [Zasmidium cellare ATCC 36951]|uniref:RING-type domain-containing protein n=1 Tax=Zasmidium cellare ATCC 36951 TaxID=1080233 RepID=A0A6A6CLH2_ZASCE|nr:uncharacterized protein M409DRAFT_22291 [Zasmidium cellare ATCC 36951]KAF2167483.1 hypothetical protein M409DRAFT_22291 [Zasmidium cellare ATCC 36951]